MGPAGNGGVGLLASARVELVHLGSDRAGKRRLFCLPGAGGSASSFRTWPGRLSPDIEVIGVQLPGRGHLVAQPPYRALQPLVVDLARAMSGMLDKPFMLFGHSMGALLGFELARWLRRAYGVAPLVLFAAACPAPQLPRRQKLLHALPSTQLWSEIYRLGGTPDQVLASDDLRALVEPALRADLMICETYQYVEERPLSCPVVVFAGSDDDVSVEELQGWTAQTTSSFRIAMFPGGHFLASSELPRLLEEIEREATR
ncbi:MAG: alpha/beta fold hydrolase [Candidatus Dormibacteraeota bacterium]|nr:alpha/beta fold hydrolase [Candidatus Dormibacteraeota bacterium]